MYVGCIHHKVNYDLEQFIYFRGAGVIKNINHFFTENVIAHGAGPVRPDQATAKLPPMRSRMASRAG